MSESEEVRERSEKISRREEYVYGVDSDTEDTAVSIAAGRSGNHTNAVLDLVFIAHQAPVAVAEENPAVGGETDDTCRGDDALDQFATHRLSVVFNGGLYDFTTDDVSSIDSGAYWDYYSDRDCYTDEA